MPIDLERTRLCFQKLERQLNKLIKKQSADNVHKFRTYSRRVETAIGSLLSTNGKGRELVEDLCRLRKRAGRLRELDAQIAAVRAMKVPEANGQKSKLLGALLEERSQREKRLAKALDRQTVRSICKDLKRTARKLNSAENVEPLTLCLRALGRLGKDHGAVTEKTLHQHRILGKQARYLAEMCAKDSDAEQLVKQLKEMQDVIGDWHDWWQLTNTAEEVLGGIKESPLVAMLRNVTRAKFRQAADKVVETRSALADKRVGLISAQALPPRKAMLHPGKSEAAVA